MEKDKFERIRTINGLIYETDSLFHQASLKLGISDSAMCILYMVYENEDRCLLSYIYKKSGISKQTINSSVRKLEKEEILYLEQYKGRSKQIKLTDKGKAFVENTVARLYKAENEVYQTFTDEEMSVYVRLMKKYTEEFRKQIEKL